MLVVAIFAIFASLPGIAAFVAVFGHDSEAETVEPGPPESGPAMARQVWTPSGPILVPGVAKMVGGEHAGALVSTQSVNSETGMVQVQVGARLQWVTAAKLAPAK